MALGRRAAAALGLGGCPVRREGACLLGEHLVIGLGLGSGIGLGIGLGIGIGIGLGMGLGMGFGLGLGLGLGLGSKGPRVLGF